MACERCPSSSSFIAPQPDHVRLGFEHGHRLREPRGLLEGMGKQVKSALRELIEAALVTRPLVTRRQTKA